MPHSLSHPARELHAEHCSIIASLTNDQRQAIDREALAKSQAKAEGRDWRTCLGECFERLAAKP